MNDTDVERRLRELEDRISDLEFASERDCHVAACERRLDAIEKILRDQNLMRTKLILK